ncbi:unnamed protein product [Chilo suppressalis]|uniref:Cuticle protein n=1 Tax=Chilo suppressalis TaxID=168631 RepID=A0ABN8AW31_CHISP|nr:unnamed protein product [Chilo suppressalis]
MMKLVVLSCLLAAVSAGLIAPIAPIAYTTSYLAPYNYRGPFSLAPGQPANILAADGRPLDTLEVNLDRSAHLTAKALEGVHILKKRSAPIIAAAPIAYTTSYLAPYNYRGPLSLAPGQPANILAADGRPLDTLEVNLDRSAHLTAKALEGFHILKKRSAPIIAAAPIAYTTSYLAPYNYRGPLSLAPGQPANILAADGRPLDTLEVNLDRSAHLTAKALEGVHILKKRSAPIIAAAPIAYTQTLAAPAHVAYSTPIATPLAASYGYINSYSSPLVHL